MMRLIANRFIAPRSVAARSTACRSGRRGTALMELMITMSATSLVFMVVISVIHQSFRMGSQQMRRSSDDATLDSLSSQWRTDVARAKAFSWPDEQTLQIVDQEENVVTYTTDSQSMIRKDDWGDQAFSMSAFYEFQWEQAKETAALHVRRRPIEHADSIEFRVWAIDLTTEPAIIADASFVADASVVAGAPAPSASKATNMTTSSREGSLARSTTTGLGE